MADSAEVDGDVQEDSPAAIEQGESTLAETE
jgi:hypothetical protein